MSRDEIQKWMQANWLNKSQVSVADAACQFGPAKLSRVLNEVIKCNIVKSWVNMMDLSPSHFLPSFGIYCCLVIPSDNSSKTGKIGISSPSKAQDEGESKLALTNITILGSQTCSRVLVSQTVLLRLSWSKMAFSHESAEKEMETLVELGWIGVAMLWAKKRTTEEGGITKEIQEKKVRYPSRSATSRALSSKHVS